MESVTVEGKDWNKTPVEDIKSETVEKSKKTKKELTTDSTESK
jgi:hypothetical protein